MNIDVKVIHNIVAKMSPIYKNNNIPQPTGIYSRWARLIQCNVIYRINKLIKKKNCMLISIDTIKAFDIFQHLILIKSLSKLGIERNPLSLIKHIYKQTSANMLRNWMLFHEDPSKKRDGCSFSALLLNILL